MQEENKSKPSFMEQLTGIPDEDQPMYKEQIEKEDISIEKRNDPSSGAHTFMKSDHPILIKFIYPLIVIIAVLLAIFFLGKIGGYNSCPSGEHEDNPYGRFGDSVCVPD
jgi:hypothetical protein